MASVQLSKRIGSRYVSTRTRAWLKTKNPNFERDLLTAAAELAENPESAACNGERRQPSPGNRSGDCNHCAADATSVRPTQLTAKPTNTAEFLFEKEVH